MEPWVTPEMIAEHLGTEVRHILDLTRRGIIPGRPLDPAAERKQWRYKKSEVDDAMRGNSTKVEDKNATVERKMAAAAPSHRNGGKRG